ncbi:hypothetical protein QQF64_016908 [Cirrhinus molitorella]|uniref:Uncharacterized protein n=1 Tax=Cirrhinus molitorella TaxID=172907 RepID=A0ABR3LSE4_9TELE
MNTVNVLFLNVPRQIKRFPPPYVCGSRFEPTNPQCSPESRVKTEPTWTNTSPSFPSAGAPAGPLGGFEPTWRSQWVSRNAYDKARPRSRARSSGNIED